MLTVPQVFDLALGVESRFKALLLLAVFGKPAVGRASWPRCAGLVIPGMLTGYHVHDLRHTGNTFASRTGATLKDLMGRMGHATRLGVCHSRSRRIRTARQCSQSRSLWLRRAALALHREAFRR